MSIFGVVAGLIDVFFPDDLAKEGTALAVAVAIASCIWMIWRSWPRLTQASYGAPKTQIRVVEGDLFAQTSHIVVGMSTTFDTETPIVIAKDSVQGQLLERWYNGDVNRLNSQVHAALRTHTPASQFTRQQKPQGKLDCYPVGTVAALRQNSGKVVFASAYTTMLPNCTVRTDVNDIWASLGALWAAVDGHANGEPVAIPVIGLGRSGISTQLPAMDSIRLIALSFIFTCRTKVVSSRLDIIVHHNDLHCIDLLEIQAFLDSLGKTS